MFTCTRFEIYLHQMVFLTIYIPLPSGIVFNRTSEISKMKLRIFLNTLLIFFLYTISNSVLADNAPPCSWAGGSATKTYDPSEPYMDTKLFVDQVEDSLSNLNLKGYAAAVVNKSGDVVASIYKGVARTKCDPDGYEPYTSYTRGGVGSVTKIVTSLALLSALETSPKDLDTLLIDVLPFRWRNKLHDRFSGVTLRHLASHTAGLLRESCGSHNPLSGLKKSLFTGELLGSGCGNNEAPPAVGVKQYSNTGFKFIGELFGYIAMPSLMAWHEDRYKNANDEDYDRTLISISHNMFYHKVRQMFDKINAKADMCGTHNYVGTNWSYANVYSSGQDTHGTILDFDPQDYPYWTCGAGTLIVSVRDLARFMSYVENTELIISKESLSEMKEPTIRVGWYDKSVVGPYDEDFYPHNGLWNPSIGGGSIRGWLGVSDNYYVAFHTQTTPAADGNGVPTTDRISNAMRASINARLKDNAVKTINAANNIIFTQ